MNLKKVVICKKRITVLKTNLYGLITMQSVDGNLTENLHLNHVDPEISDNDQSQQREG